MKTSEEIVKKAQEIWERHPHEDQRLLMKCNTVPAHQLFHPSGEGFSNDEQEKVAKHIAQNVIYQWC